MYLYSVNENRVCFQSLANANGHTSYNKPFNLIFIGGLPLSWGLVHKQHRHQQHRQAPFLHSYFRCFILNHHCRYNTAFYWISNPVTLIISLKRTLTGRRMKKTPPQHPVETLAPEPFSQSWSSPGRWNWFLWKALVLGSPCLTQVWRRGFFFCVWVQCIYSFASLQQVPVSHHLV